MRDLTGNAGIGPRVADGSLALYAQAEARRQGRGQLAEPKAPFNVILRAYGPKNEMLNGTYKLPPMTRMS